MQQASNTNSTNTNSTKDKANKKNKPGVTTFLAFGALVVSVISLSLHFQGKKASQMNLDQLHTAVFDEVSKIKTQFQRHDKKFNQQLIKLSNDQQGLKKQNETLRAGLITLSKEKRGSDRHWQLAKANYLIDLAQLAVYWDKTPNTAIALLNAADTLIKSLNDPQFIALRQTLSNEITSLKAVPEVDITKLVTTLSSLSQHIDSLPLTNESFKTPTQEPKTKTNITKDPSRWQKALDTTKDTLSKLVIIRYHKHPVTPLLPPKERLELVDTIRLALMQAQWSVLHRNKTLYRFYLNTATTLIKKYFDTSQKDTQMVLQTLVNLSANNIAPTLPDISRSKKQIQAFISHKQKGRE